MLDGVLGPQASYDLIAPIYEHDMWRNMPFDDAGFYAGVARRAGKTTLELGCGTGRITRALLAAGLEVTCVDISPGMLNELRRALKGFDKQPLVVQMDISLWSLKARFDSILCPYSLITYVTEPEAIATFLKNVHSSLKAGGTFVVDAFCPRAEIQYGERMQDYRRTLPDGSTLTRSKVIERDDRDSIHLIRRSYEIADVAGKMARAFETSTRIRSYTPLDLASRLEQSSFAVKETYWDYDASKTESNAKFVSYCCTAD
jgi:SAM-dependent methyltransferase